MERKMLTIGQTFPEFNVTGVTSNEMSGFKQFDNHSANGKWQVFFFWPKDFTFICPTEIEEFGALNEKFNQLNTQLYGVSTDSEFVHMAWRKSHPGLSNLPFPMLSDIKRDLSATLGILHPEAGVCLRATYIVDPEGVIRHVSVNDLSVGRNPAEILRILEGLQNGGLMPCNWQPGQAPLKVA
jgi:peroxiredoxin (alkyl hydroperoxide reductase subunit C)